jgi:hypothetical protein
VIAAIEAALLNGQAQPWMYDILALTMQMAGRPKADIERVLLSRVDFFATDVTSTLLSAAYLTRFGAKEQALKLYRQAAELEPTRPEAYVLGLRLARGMKDADAIQWAATGVLRAAWTSDFEQIHREAEDAALDAERALRAAGKTAQAEALSAAMVQAHIRDISIRLQWAGDADLDLVVEEPLGTVCSVQNPQTRGGGVHLHDGFGPDPQSCYEQYVCAYGVSGVYVVHVRRVDGNVVGKRAQLTVTRNQGAKDESTEVFVVRLSGDQAAVRVPLTSGRRTGLGPDRKPPDRKSSAIERFLHSLVFGSAPPNIPVAALPGVVAPGAVAAGVGAVPAISAPFPASPGLAVGIQPIITTVTEGATLNAAAVVSQDLRYVRLAVQPNFSTITDVFTFTFLH